MYSINGYEFQNEEDVDVAREELNKIQYISEKLTDDPEAVLAVYNKMLDSKIFITPVGVEYLRQLQGYLLRSSQIDDAQVRDVPVLISYQDALHYKDLEQALAQKEKAPQKKSQENETVPEKLKRRYRFSIITIVVLAVMVAAMFVIALNSNTPNILNYRTELENEYADWAQQLSEKEEELRERENALGGQ